MGKKNKSKITRILYNDVLPKRFKPILVIWEDTSMSQGWVKASDEKATTIEFESLGWLIHKNKKSLTMCMSVSAGIMGEVLSIPAGCIKKVVHLDD